MKDDFPGQFSNLGPSYMFKLDDQLVQRMTGSIYQIISVQMARDPQTNTELQLFGLKRKAVTDDTSYAGLLSAARLADSFYVLK